MLPIAIPRGLTKLMPDNVRMLAASSSWIKIATLRFVNGSFLRVELSLRNPCMEAVYRAGGLRSSFIVRVGVLHFSSVAAKQAFGIMSVHKERFACSDLPKPLLVKEGL